MKLVHDKQDDPPWGRSECAVSAMEPSDAVDDLQTTVTAFLKGTRRLVTVGKAVDACQSTSTQANVSVGRTAESWKRVAHLHNAPFGRALFDRLTVTRMFANLVTEIVCAECAVCFCLRFSAKAGHVVDIMIRDHLRHTCVRDPCYEAVVGRAEKICKEMKNLRNLKRLRLRRTVPLVVRADSGGKHLLVSRLQHGVGRRSCCVLLVSWTSHS